MAEHEGVAAADELDETPGYKAPEEKPLADILSADRDDAALEQYKKTLLGADPTSCEPRPEDPRTVIVTKLALCVDGRPDLEMALEGSLADLVFVVQEGCQYRLKIFFLVQREIVTGLRYQQKTLRKGIPVDKNNLMVGSYGPKMDVQSWQSPVEDAPSGMMARGSYTIKSKFTDDDKNTYLEWSWTLKIKENWAE